MSAFQCRCQWGTETSSTVSRMGTCAQLSGLRFLLFPPLIVIAYEMFAHAKACPWAIRPWALPVVCSLTAAVGVTTLGLLHNKGIAAGCTMSFGLIFLWLGEIHMAPALAVGLIPLIMRDPDWKYPLSVLGGTISLALVFHFYQRNPKGGSESRLSGHATADVSSSLADLSVACPGLGSTPLRSK